MRPNVSKESRREEDRLTDRAELRMSEEMERGAYPTGAVVTGPG